jgi:SAM-dependent methyltransferase
VLELGAGTGRATAFLARAASRVVALDLSLDLAAVARRRLAGIPGASVLVADMRQVRLAARFDLVVAVDDPFVHLIEDDDRDRALATVARHLAPGGRFVLDAAWLSPPRRRAAARPPGLRVERRHGAHGELAVREEWRCEAGSRRCAVRFAYLLHGEPVAAAEFPGRLWSLAEMERRFRRAGLAITALWGDYDRRPWDRITSPRLIAEARPAGSLSELVKNS